jgi:hypothetical protein
MNTETGRIYSPGQESEAALARGEPVVEVSARVAALVERGALELDKDDRRAAWRKRWLTPPAPPVT